MLEASDWLRALSLADREALAAQMEEVFFRAGDSLFRQGDNPEGFFIIALGAIEFSVGALGEERLMYRTGAGGSLGAIALITGSPYTVNASALTAVRHAGLIKKRSEPRSN
jgi:CRP-like cAMP-binding protein